MISHKEVKSKLILYVDINKTILIRDNSSGQFSEEVVLSGIIADSAWGEVIEGQWKCTYYELCKERPKEGLITYRCYLETQYPKKKVKDEVDLKELNDFNKEQKAKIRELASNFVETGSPGEIFRPVFDEALTKLKVPKNAIESLKGSKLASLLKNSRYSLIPSFFKLINKLKEEGRDFVIVFRSFGSDIENAIIEYDA